MNTVDENHRNILHYAAASGNLEMTVTLWKKLEWILRQEMVNV